MHISGTVAPGFEPVRELLVSNFARGVEDEAQICVYHKGKRVVDLWGSSKEANNYGPDSQQLVFSSSKSVTAITIAMGVDRGFLDYNQKVTHYWPEFGKNGKGEVILADVLRHEAGLPAFTNLLQWDYIQPQGLQSNQMGKVIEEAQQFFPPKKTGTRRQYHPFTRGWILNEIFRRAEPNGRTIGQFLREEVSQPMGIDVEIGVPEDEIPKIHNLKYWKLPYTLCQGLIPAALGRKIEPNIFELREWSNFFSTKQQFKRDVEVEGSEDFKAAPPFKGTSQITGVIDKINLAPAKTGEIPSVNGACSARGLARLGLCILNGGELDGHRIMSEEGVRKMTSDPKVAKDHAFIDYTTEFTQGGLNIFRFDAE